MPASILLRFRLWCAALAVLALAFGWQLTQGLTLDSDILGLLPAVEHDAAAEQAQSIFAERSARRVSLLVGAVDAESARTGAALLAEVLHASGVFRVTVPPHAGAGWTEAARLYEPHWPGLLSDRHRRWLERGETHQLRDEALRALYSPSGLARPIPAADDLLGLRSAFLLGQAASLGRAQPDRGFLTVVTGGRTWILVPAEVLRSPFAYRDQRRVMEALAHAEAVLRDALPGAELIRSGVVLHAAAAASRAAAEITLFGAVASLVIVLLVGFTFRSVRPLALCLGSLGLGAVAGVVACQWVFGNVHVITLVFGTSLIGMAVDYSLHFLADPLRDPARWTPADGLRHVGRPILICLGASLLGYAALLLAPLPGVRQMALFSIVGLTVACGCVLCLYPVLAGRAPTHDPLALRLARRSVAGRPGRRRPPHRFRPGVFAVLLAASVFAAWGLSRLQFVDDIRLMQSSPPELLAQEVALREVLGMRFDSRFFVVRGDSEELVLQREEALRDTLDVLVRDGQLGGYLAVSRALPSQRRQELHRRLLQQHVLAGDGLLPEVMRSLGVGEAAIERARAATDVQAPFLHPRTWFASPFSKPLRSLWLGDIGDGYATVVTVVDVQAAAVLMAAAEGLEGVFFADRLGSISTILREYRRTAAALIMVAYGVILVLLALRYGAGGALLVLLPPAGASLLVLGALGALGIPASLFNVLTLLLLLGMGVDYAVFLREGRRAQPTALLAVGLSAFTTTLSFGLLILSATPFIRAIGLTLAPGIALAFLLALWLKPSDIKDRPA